MFGHARRRLALQAALLFAVVLVVFSVVFFAVLTTALAPTFDIAPEISNDEAARQAYRVTIELIAAALVVANAIAITIAVVAGYVLAGRTLEPIRAAHERQRRFVADASHEMRTPLTVIRSSVDTALMESDEPRRTAAALQTISEATDRLARMTSDLLLLARTEDGSRSHVRMAVDVSVSAAEAATAARQALGATIELALTQGLIVLADEEALQRIAGNLIDNAWRYSAGQPIEVRTSGTERIATLEVEDRGPGIAQADIERVFEPFHRVRADREAPAGSGLGLAIARGLTRELGGDIRIVSRLGSGSVFHVELPRQR